MAKPKLALIPASQGSKVFSVLPSDGSGDFDFSRSGSATRINSQGLIETVSNGQSRLNYPLIDGVVSGCPSLLLENSATNLIPYSEEFDNAVWSNYRSSISPNTAISPDGTLSADKLIDTSVSGTHAMDDLILSLSSGSKYTYSIFAKADEIKQVGLLLSNPNQGRIFDLENGTILDEIIATPDASKIEDYGNGWYKCSITTTLTDTDTKVGIYLSKNNNTVFTGDNVSGLYIWGAMLEQGSYPTSYIPSLTGSQTTRSAETCNNSGDVNTFNDSEGVLMAEISALSLSDTSSRRIGITKDGTYEGLRIQLGNNNISGTVYDGTLNQYSKIISYNNEIPNKIALKYKANDFALWINGIEYEPQSSGSTFVDGTLNDLSFDYVGGADFYGNTKQIQYYDSALTDSELETLTSWTSFSDMANGQLYTIE